MKLLYRFSPFTREYLNTITATPDPEEEGFLIPANATTVAPPVDPITLKDDECLIFSTTEGKWIIEKKESIPETQKNIVPQDTIVERHHQFIHNGYWYKLIVSRITMEYLILLYMGRSSTVTVPAYDFKGNYTTVTIERKQFEDILESYISGYKHQYLDTIKLAYAMEGPC